MDTNVTLQGTSMLNFSLGRLWIYSLCVSLISCSTTALISTEIEPLKTYFNPQTQIKSARSSTFSLNGELNRTHADGFSHCVLRAEILPLGKASVLLVCDLEYVAFDPRRYVFADYQSAAVQGLSTVFPVSTLKRNYGVCLDKSRLCSTQEKISLRFQWTELLSIALAAGISDHTIVTIIGTHSEPTVKIPTDLLTQLINWKSPDLQQPNKAE